MTAKVLTMPRSPGVPAEAVATELVALRSMAARANNRAAIAKLIGARLGEEQRAVVAQIISEYVIFGATRNA